MTTQDFRIVWPERRVLSARQISSMYLDAHANGDLDHEDDGALTDAREQALALHHAGLITLTRD